MAEILELLEAAEERPQPNRRTGFAYCPPPTAATERAYDGQAVYSPLVIFLAFVGSAGAAWMIGSTVLWAMARR